MGSKAGQRISISAPPWVWASLAYFLAVLAVFRRTILHPLTQVPTLFTGDLPRLFYPMRAFALDQAKAGHYLPLWDPHIYGGAPFLGNFESALLYPLNFLFFVLPIPAALNVFLLFHEFLAGLFMYLWASSRKFHPATCWLAGLLYMFGGAFFLHIYAGHMTHLATITWVPLIFLILDKIIESRKVGWVLVGIAAVTLQVLAGFPQYFYISSLIAGLYVFLILWKKGGALKSLGQVALVYFGALGLSAIQWGAGLAASRECLRGLDLGYDFAGSYSLPPEDLLTSFLPDLFEKYQVFHYGRSDIFWDSNLFLGTMALALLTLAIISLKGKERWVPLAVIGTALVLAFGSYSPIFHFLYDYLPGISHLRGNSKFKLMACLFLALLAAAGLDLLLLFKPLERRKKTPWILAAGLFLIILGSLAFIWPSEGSLLSLNGTTVTKLSEGTWTQARIALAWDLLAAGAALSSMALLIRLVGNPMRLGLGLAFLSALELFSFTQTHLTYTDWRSVKAQEKTIENFLKDNPGDYRVMTNMGDRVEAAGASRVWGCDPFVPFRYYQFMAFTQGTDEKGFLDRVGNSQNFRVISGLFHLIRCRYAVMDLTDRLSVTQFAGKDLPRVSLMGQWEKGSGPKDILPRLADPRFPYLSKTILEEDPGFPSSGRPVKGQVKVMDLSTDRMEVTADLKNPALLVLGENYTEGWKAEAYPDSGEKNYRVIPADYILRAVPLTKGHNHFSLVYRPTAYVIGLWISIFSLVLYLGALGWWIFLSFFTQKAKN